MKKRITIYLDQEVLDAFRTRAEETGAGYQTMINDSLKESLARESKAPPWRTLAEALLAIPTIEGHDDLFERAEDDAESDDVFD